MNIQAQKTPATIALSNIFMGENVRIAANMAVESLRADIVQRGLHDPIVVHKEQDGSYQVVQGHRRYTAIQELEDQFSEGVPCLVVEGLSEIEILTMKVDHGNQESLKHPFEVQKAANFLFSANYTEEQVAVTLNGIMNTVAPMKASKRKELTILEAQLTEAVFANLPELIAKIEKEIKDLVGQYRRGKVQNLSAAFNSPEIVMQALAKDAGEEVPKDVTLPSTIKYTQVVKLRKAHVKDLDDINENGTPKYSKLIPGPQFQEAWLALLKADTENQSRETVTAPKSLGAKQIAEELKTGKYQSTVAQQVAMHCAGNKEADWVQFDLNAFYGEIVAEVDPKLWDKVEKLAKVEIAKQNQAKVEADKS